MFLQDFFCITFWLDDNHEEVKVVSILFCFVLRLRVLEKEQKIRVSFLKSCKIDGFGE